MNLNGVDLNLLVVLDALLDEAHVSRAAQRLGRSQPAISAALDRCRHLFGDPLLQRQGGSMKLTPRAEALRVPVKAILSSVSAVVTPQEPGLASRKRTVRLLLADVPAVLLTAKLLSRMADSAPLVDLVILPWHASPSASEALVKGDCDLAVSVFPVSDRALRHQPLFGETYRVLMRRGHPAAADFGLDHWIAHPHVIVSGLGAQRTLLDDQLAAIGRSRRVGVVVPSFSLVPPLLLNSDLIAMLPTRCLPKSNESEFVSFEPPIDVPGFTVHLVWHARNNEDLVVRHVAALTQEILK